MLLFYARGPHGRSAKLRKKFFRISILVLLAGVALYSVAGYVVAPRFVKFWIENSITTGPGYRLGVGNVQVNPFALFISLTDVTLIGQDNKKIVSIGQLETSLQIKERLRRSKAGFDVAIRALQVANPSTGDVILTIPDMSATSLVINAAQGAVTLGAARLRNPEFHLMRDAAGQLRLPAWLRLLQEGAPPAPVEFETLEVMGGTLRFTDYALSPALRLDAVSIVGTVARRRPSGAESMVMEFEGRFGESGSGQVIAEWRAPQRNRPTTVDLALQRIELAALSDYFARRAGRSIAAGTGDLALHYERRETTTRIDGQIDVDRLQLGDDIATDSNGTTPLYLVAALTTDETGRIDLSIPILQSGDDVDPAAAIVDSLTNYCRDLAATPFNVLAVLVGREEEDLGRLAFPPGSAEITVATADKIKLLGRALSRRPLIALRARPAYDAVADRDAIAAQQVNLHIRLATVADSSASSAQTSIDFEDPKVRLILDEFAGARLPESRRLAISRRFGDKDVAYYRALHDALVGNEDVSETVLRRLARFRARSVFGALTESGVDKKRLLLDDAIETAPSDSDDVVVRLEAIVLQKEH